MANFSLRIPEYLLGKLKEYAKKKKLTPSEFIRYLIKRELIPLPPHCNICNLRKEIMVDSVCFDCLSDKEKLNYHPLEP